MPKNKNLILFIVIGFVVTVMIWGFVGGCGTVGFGSKKTAPPKTEEEDPAEVKAGKQDLTNQADGIVYIVETGDTLWKISKKSGVGISSIREVNNLDTDTIAVGQKLIIPGSFTGATEPSRRASLPGIAGNGGIKEAPLKVSAEAPAVLPKKIEPKDGQTVYKVQKGDSLWRIAQKNGVVLEKLAELNNLSKNVKLVPGQELLLPEERR